MPVVKPASASTKKLRDNRGAQEVDEAGQIRFDGRTALFALLLFCSGAAALIYKVLWIKQLSLIVGVEVYSVTIAVSAFFAGLALGGAVIGHWADRLPRPFILYAILEAGVGVLSITSAIALANTAGPFVAIEARAGLLAWALPFVLVGAPAFLMGGTLPLAVRAWAPVRDRIAGAGGAIYAANTAGGIAGALLSSFALLPWLGVRGTAFAAGVLNVAAATAAFVLERRSQNRERVAARPVEEQNVPAQARLALALYAIAGGIALGYEVVWSQAMAQFMSTRVFAFSMVLATYLAGLMAGSAIYARFADRVRDSWGVFGLFISAAGVVALFEIAGLNLWQLRIQIEAGNLAFSATGSEFVRMCAQFLVAALGVVFVPTVCWALRFRQCCAWQAAQDGQAGRLVRFSPSTPLGAS
jgi:predicted membrane-bound spermidine synthase